MTNIEIDSINLIDDARAAVRGVSKNSRLRSHYIELVKINNIMRVFVTQYKLDPSYKASQESLLDVLLKVEARKNRVWLTAEKIVLQDVLKAYEELISCSSQQDIIDVITFVEDNKNDSKWIVFK